MSKIFSNVWIKCISFLLILSVLLSGVLAVLNELLYVTPEERTNRAISKIYDGAQKQIENTVLDIDAGDTAIEYEFGRINKLYEIANENGSVDKLFQTTGFNGFKNGTITLWVKVINQNEKLVIDKVVLESYDKQTLMSKLDSNYYGVFYKDITNAYKNGQMFTTDNYGGNFYNPISGATYSADAGNNAVNCVIAYIGGAK